MGFSKLLPADPRAWALAAMVVLVAFIFGMIGRGVMQRWSPLPPPHVFDTASLWTGWTEDGAWTVHWDIEITEFCETRVYTQRFRDETTNTDFTATPLRAHPTAGEQPIYDGTRPPGVYENDWRDFRPILGRKGVFWLSVASAGCPSGYNGIDTLFVAPYDWTRIPADNMPDQNQASQFKRR